jgi:hypothetical protein
MAYQTSQGLASLGRNGDSVLVHMSPTEVAGLQGLAMAQGGSLTINPHTGLPEAFSIGGFFKSLLPTIAGFAAAGMSGGAMSPMLAGILAGSATGAATSKDPLTGALMGGLGGYGGANLFGAANAFTPAVSGTTGQIGGANLIGKGVSGATGLSPGAVGSVGTTGQMGGGNLIGSGVAGSTSSNALPVGFKQAVAQSGSTMDQALLDPLVKQQISMYTPSATAGQTAALGGNQAKFGALIDNAVPAATQYSPNFESIPGAAQGFGGAPANTLSQAYKNVAADPIGFIGQNKMAVGMPIGGALLGGLEPSDLYGEPINMDEAKRKQRYDPNATLNLSGDTGLRLYATGGTIQSGGIRDLYGTPDNQPTISPGLSGFGLGRLNNLAGEQAMTQAQTLGYAEGGDISNYRQDQAALNLDDLPSLNLGDGSSGRSEVMQRLISASRNMGESHSDPRFRTIGNFMSGMFSGDPAIINRMRGGKAPSMAQGGPVSFADGGDSNKEDALGLPSLSPDMSMDPNAGASNLAMIQSAMQPTQGMQGNAPMTLGQMPDQSNDSLIAKVTANLKVDPNYQPENPIEAAIVKQIRGTDPMQQGQPSLQGLGSLGPAQPSQPMAPSYNPSQSMAPSFNPSVAMGPTYFAGINAPQGYARGGYLDGQGDGMSDSIPATIEGKQPARLADGEFVIPADVVSHIGNGSSKAGSKRLYAMLDKVRHARTGNKKQGKEIKAEKYLPA